MAEVRGGEVVRGEVAGVPAFWPAEPDPTRSALGGTLVFRVGTADETLPTHGITHLVEHLALHAVDDGRRVINGSVGHATTDFVCEGTPEDVAGFLRDVTRALRDLPFDRLETERRVLRTEAEGFAPTIDHRLLNHRYGPASYGLPLWSELAFGWVGPDELRAWVERSFTRGNAVLWFTAAPPDGIELELPDGPRRPRPEARPIPELECPCFLADGTGGVVVGSAARWSPQLTGALILARERLQDRLRRDEGLSYGTSSDAAVLSGEVGHAILGADCSDEHAPRVLDVLLRTIEDLAAGGATEEELRAQVARAERALVDADPDGDARAAATDALDGEREVWSRARMLEDVSALTAESVAEAMRTFAASAIVIASEGTPKPPGRMVEWRSWEHEPVTEGRRFRRSRDHHPGEAEGDLVVGEDGLTFDGVTIRFDRVAAAMRRPFGEVTLIADDDRGVTIDPDGREDGVAALELVLSRIPDERVVPGRDHAVGERLADAAAEWLPDPRRLGGALRGLARVLGLEEPVELLAAFEDPDARHPGVLCATPDRVLGVLNDETGSWFAAPWPEVTRAEASTGLRRGRLTLEADGVTYALKVTPKDRAAAFAEQAAERRAAAPVAADEDDGRRLF